MTVANLAIVHPRPGAMLSGGHIFNTQVLHWARRCNCPLQALCEDEWQRCAAPWDVLIWDSLLLERVERIGRERIGVLLHYLPSLEPGLESNRLAQLRANEERAIACADFIITTGKALGAWVDARWPGKRVFVCEPGVSEAFRRRPPRDAHRTLELLTVANLLPAKGHESLLRILQRARHLPWHWHVVGDDGAVTAARLRSCAAHARLIDRMTFHGSMSQRQVAASMTSADLLLHPSAFESYGMVIAEAAAVGLPVIAFQVGEAARLIEHGATGYLAAAGDWEGFGSFVLTLLRDAALRAVFERNLAAAPVRGWDRVFADFREACETMLR